jgi:hypothetical protein
LLWLWHYIIVLIGQQGEKMKYVVPFVQPFKGIPNDPVMFVLGTTCSGYKNCQDQWRMFDIDCQNLLESFPERFECGEVVFVDVTNAYRLLKGGKKYCDGRRGAPAVLKEHAARPIESINQMQFLNKKQEEKFAEALKTFEERLRRP